MKYRAAPPLDPPTGTTSATAHVFSRFFNMSSHNTREFDMPFENDHPGGPVTRAFEPGRL
jgi:hypothetical protein